MRPSIPSCAARSLAPASLARRRVRPEGRRRRDGERRRAGDRATAGADRPPAPAARRRRRRRPASTAPRPARPRPARAPPTTAARRRRRRTAAADDGGAAAGPFEPGAERHRRRHRRRDRDRHPRPGHRRVADPAGRASTSARTSTGSSSPTATPDALFGRNVRVVFRDDEFNPQRAVQVCREMVEQEGAFLLVGGGGADQITACAQYANEDGIPYLSAGVNETGPRRPRHLLRHVADLRRAGAADHRPAAGRRASPRSALVVADTPSFDDAYDGVQGRGRGGRPRASPYETRINKDASPAEAADRRPGAEELRRRGRHPAQLAGRVLLGLAPGGRQPELHPMWIGPGITSGLNAVTAIGCPAVGTGEFFSPVPGPRRDRRARPRLQPGLRRSSPAASRGRRHRAAAVGAEQGDRADVRGDRARSSAGPRS